MRHCRIFKVQKRFVLFLPGLLGSPVTRMETLFSVVLLVVSPPLLPPACRSRFLPTDHIYCLQVSFQCSLVSFFSHFFCSLSQATVSQSLVILFPFLSMKLRTPYGPWAPCIGLRVATVVDSFSWTISTPW